MSRYWPRARLGDVATPAERAEAPLPGTSYRQIGVRLWGEGAYERESIDGAWTKYARLFRAEAGDIIVNKIWARNGSVAVVPEALAGCYGSSEFPMFAPKRDAVDPRWLHWLTKTEAFWAQCEVKSRGTSGKNRIRPDRFLAIEIPLPPLREQQRIAVRIEAFAAQIQEARTHRQKATDEADALIAAQFGAVFESLAGMFAVLPLDELTSLIIDGPHQTPQYLPDAVAGIPFVTVKNMVTGVLRLTDLNHISVEDHHLFTRRGKPERGDVLYSKDGATRGRPCLVDTDEEFSYFVSVALIKPLRDRLDGRYLVHLLNSRWIKDRMTDRSRGDMIPHIVLREIRAFPVPCPPVPLQRRIVDKLDTFQREVDTLKRAQQETAAQLDALLPAVLDHALRGEL